MQSYPQQSYGQPAQQYGQGMSPQEYQQLQAWFAAVDVDRSGSIDAAELQRALSSGGNVFDIATARLLMKMFDPAHQGSKLDFNSFVGCHKYIMSAKETFNQCDADRDGRLSIPEARNAIQRFGFQLSDQALKANMQAVDKALRGSLEFTQFFDMITTLAHARNVLNYMSNNQGQFTCNMDAMAMVASYFKN